MLIGREVGAGKRQYLLQTSLQCICERWDNQITGLLFVYTLFSFACSYQYEHRRVSIEKWTRDSPPFCTAAVQHSPCNYSDEINVFSQATETQIVQSQIFYLKTATQTQYFCLDLLSPDARKSYTPMLRLPEDSTLSRHHRHGCRPYITRFLKVQVGNRVVLFSGIHPQYYIKTKFHWRTHLHRWTLLLLYIGNQLE